jgi:hypothetical protein
MEGTPIYFVTLTTPVEYWSDVLPVYKALRSFREAFQRRYESRGYLGAIVRREVGRKRGMLHYHLVIVGGGLLEPGRKKIRDQSGKTWIGRKWTEALGYEAGFVRVEVEWLDTAERVAKYLSKYCTKVGFEGRPTPDGSLPGQPEDAPAACEDAPQVPAEGAVLSKAHNGGWGHTGTRWWYVWGEKSLPWGEMLLIHGDFARGIAKRVRRIFVRWLVDKERARLLRQAKELGRSVEASVWRISVRELLRWSKFGSFLVKGRGGGYTILATPALLAALVEYAEGEIVIAQ